MTRNERRFRIKELQKEANALNKQLDTLQKKMPDKYALFDENEGDFRAGTYKDKKLQSLYDYIADIVNKIHAIKETIKKLKEQRP